MKLIDLTTLRARLAPGQRLLGIDPGSKTVGLAMSDVSLTIASPYGSLPRGKIAVMAVEILRIAHRHGIGGIVVGLPLSLDGSLGPAAQAARDWSHALTEATELPVAQFDERLSSSAVNRFLINEADLSRKKRAEAVDKLAAAYMLQSALDATADMI
jgi:putative Holliday junction resolvase